MSVLTVTSSTRTALAAAITAGGLECRTYDSWDIDAGNIATLGPAEWDLTERHDQSYGFGIITIRVFVYQLIDGALNESMQYLETNVERVVDGLGSDRTLGGKAPDSEIVGMVAPEFFRDASGAAWAVAALDVAVRPFANAGS